MKLPVKTERGQIAGLDTIKIKIEAEVETFVPPLENSNVSIEEREVNRLNRFLKDKLGITEWKHSLRDLLLLTQEKEPNQAKIVEKLIGLIKDIEEFELIGTENTEGSEDESN